jgi:hypothetical protein
VKGSRQTIPTILDESSLQRSDSPLHKQQESSAPQPKNFADCSPPPPPPPEQFDHYPDLDLPQPPPPNLEFGVSFDFPMPPPSENDQLASYLVNHFEHFEFGVNGDWPMPSPLENDESASRLSNQTRSSGTDWGVFEANIRQQQAKNRKRQERPKSVTNTISRKRNNIHFEKDMFTWW